MAEKSDEKTKLQIPIKLILYSLAIFDGSNATGKFYESVIFNAQCVRNSRFA